MDSRNFVNSERYAKLLREKSKRETKIAKMQTKIFQEEQKLQQLQPLCPKKPKKLDEKWIREHHQTAEESNVVRKRPPISPVVERKKLSGKVLASSSTSDNDNDLLSEIDNSLPGDSRGFVYKKGN